MNYDILDIIEKAFSAGRESAVLEDIFRDVPYMSKSEAIRYFREDAREGIKNEIASIEKFGGNKKAQVSVSGLIKMRALRKLEKIAKKANT